MEIKDLHRSFQLRVSEPYHWVWAERQGASTSAGSVLTLELDTFLIIYLRRTHLLSMPEVMNFQCYNQ